MNSLFRNCREIITIDISNFNTSKVTTISYFFSQCTKLKNVYYLSNLDSSSIVDRIGMFDGCDSLFSPDNPNYQSNINESDIITTSTIISSKINIVMLLLNKLIITNSIATFNIYFVSLDDFNFPQTFSLSVEIIYNSVLRFLDNKNANCQLEDLFGDIKTKYNCSIDIENSNIKNIAIDEDINFGINNINIEQTPFVSNYMNNIQDIPKDFDNFSEDSKIYILKNCIITDKHDNSFNISGIMEGEPNYNIGKNIANPRRNKM